MSSVVIPRLRAGEAIQLLADHARRLGEGTTADYLVDTSRISTDDPGAGPLPDSQQVDAWREAIVARLTGFDLHTKEGRDGYGMELGRAIAEVIDPIGSDASHDGVWSYLSLRVLPDVVLARWPGETIVGELRLPADRWIGAQSGNQDRSYLKQSWRRWQILGPVMVDADPLFGEAEFAAMLGRPSLARDQRLIRQAATAILSYGAGQPGGRSEFARKFMALIAARTGSMLLDILSDEELRDFVEEEASSIVRSRARRGV
ncbi:hypothetical protein [Acidipropionibacterium jensenii]|uniref:Uncharacterized protein n=1 Tax=Acidipropionibacterium jensenii TaxID=1749 RepID=A0A3Q9UI32_9ACTN|nr:hypothetical protein [Acidipropionibacterium jensenii]AZZ38721.1 hypothetical protein C0Z10_01980 [Acidipropionibacterium jensenii]MDN5977954.1 hypothetical protein [Acidipropionibacterium jensenii]MDN5996124.1 hypothetical protein [Acidipropionibacterium jensenii]MDN6427581.1 hypothetical protein [Acidipropionibacterium jensenii]MDN6441367.1 hypothetical protein [Acidipropionibacterium jensenii]